MNGEDDCLICFTGQVSARARLSRDLLMIIYQSISKLLNGVSIQCFKICQHLEQNAKHIMIIDHYAKQFKNSQHLIRPIVQIFQITQSNNTWQIKIPI